MNKLARRKTRRPPGRPALDPAHRRTIRVKVSLSPFEQEVISLFAANSGLAPATYIRRAALKQRLPRSVPSINRDAFRVLAGIGANLNQFMHHLNSGPGTAYSVSLPNLHALFGLLLTVKGLLVGRDK